MSSLLTTDEIIEQIQVLRSGLLPGYAEDGDEGERSIQEYNAFYENNITTALGAGSAYLDSFQALLEDSLSPTILDATDCGTMSTACRNL